jgi:hypothetical protein
MNVCVLGHSDSIGDLLAPTEDPWPTILARRLSVLAGRPASVAHFKFRPFGPRAVELAIDRVIGCDAEIVIIPLCTYWCGYRVVSASVRRRLGKRAERWYLAGQHSFSRHAEGARGEHHRHLIRRAVRKVLGTQPLASVEEVTQVYATVFRRLSHDEHVQLVALADHHFTPAGLRSNPGILEAGERIHAAVKGVVDRRRLIWAQTEDAIRAGGRRDEMFMPDGVHLTGEAHRQMAALLERLLVEHHALGKEEAPVARQPAPLEPPTHTTS